jgi:hypothetical protein
MISIYPCAGRARFGFVKKYRFSNEHQDAGMSPTWQSTQRVLANLRLAGKNTVFPYSCFARTSYPGSQNNNVSRGPLRLFAARQDRMRSIRMIED